MVTKDIVVLCIKKSTHSLKMTKLAIVKSRASQNAPMIEKTDIVFEISDQKY